MARVAKELHPAQVSLLRGQHDVISRTRAQLVSQENLHQVMLKLACPEAEGAIVFFAKEGLAEYDVTLPPEAAPAAE